MSRRIKPDRRTVADRGTIIEVERPIVCPDIPADFVLRLRDIQRGLINYALRLENEDCRDDLERSLYVSDIFYHCLDPLDYLLEEYGMLTEEKVPAFWLASDWIP